MYVTSFYQLKIHGYNYELFYVLAMVTTKIYLQKIHKRKMREESKQVTTKSQRNTKGGIKSGKAGQNSYKTHRKQLIKLIAILLSVIT